MGAEAKLIAYAVVLAILAAAALALGIHFDHAGAARVQAAWDKDKAAQAAVDATQNAKNRAAEQAAATAKQEASDARAAAQVQIAATGAALRADADRVRGQLTNALSGRGAAQDSLAACQQRGSDAGDLLDDGLHVQIELAGKAEALAADARAVRHYSAGLPGALTGASQ